MTVVAGTVDWSGENPGMYLRESPDGAYSALASFFRVVVSPHGPGHAAFVFLDPTGSGSDERPNACYTDNEPLARYLEKGFISFFGAFKGNANLGRVQYRAADRFCHEGSHATAWREIVTGPGVHLELEWSELYDTFQLDVPPEGSATGQHRMFSTFVSARGASLRVNGQVAAGRPFPRNAHGRESSSAFLAFSETWLKPDR
jgi:hypothetical protein